MTMRAGALQSRRDRSSANQSSQGRHGDEGEPRGMSASTVYRDFALVSTDAILKIVDTPKAKRKGPRGGVQTPFPVRLYDMLEASQKEGLGSIVSWQPHGRSFIVRKPDQFEARILPRFFSQSKMSSFQRQLNLYGFLRQNTGIDRGSYYHELFLRGRPDLPKLMIRTRVKGIGMGRTNKVEKEPDFYNMTHCLTKRDKPSFDVKEPKVLPPVTSSLSPKPCTVSYQEDTEPEDSPSTRKQQWHGPPHVVPVHRRVSPEAFTAVVTPMAESGGRPLFTASPCSSLSLSERAASLADPSMYPPRYYIHTSQAPPPQPPLNGSSHVLSHSVHTFSSQVPLLPLSDHYHHQVESNNLYLHPRYNNTDTGDDDLLVEDMALFEGLEFQVVDDDSLEQFESELISDGGSVSESI